MIEASIDDHLWTLPAYQQMSTQIEGSEPSIAQIDMDVWVVYPKSPSTVIWIDDKGQTVPIPAH